MTAQKLDNVSPLPPKIEHGFVLVDPATAQRWLERNDNNRPVRVRKVAEYAESMQAGQWTISNDDICFDPEGRLLNGQHRLSAVIQSGATVLMGVKRNVPPTAMQNMDTGSARAAGDYLGWQGEKNPQLLGSILKQLILIDTGRLFGDTRKQVVSRHEYTDYLERNPLVRASTDLAQSVYQRTDATPTALGVTHYVIARVNGLDEANRYIIRLADRVEEPQGSPILAIDSRLREMRRNRAKVSNKHLVYLLLKGYNYLARGLPVRKLSLTPKAAGDFRLPDVVRLR